MSLISLVGVGKDFGIKTLFENLTLHVGEKERLGLIGPNGAGKSTLLKLLAGQETPGEGERRASPRLKVVMVSQEPDLEASRTVLEQVTEGCGEKIDLLRRFTAVSEALAEEPSAEDPGHTALLAELGTLQGRLDQCQAWDLEQQCLEVLDRLGIQDVQQQVGNLSGGFRKRLALASALVAEPDVLLLDEPTNHLDAQCIEWLQDQLERLSGALVLVTHDRYFLDRVTRRIVEVDRGEARSYAGNYAAYLQTKADEEAAEAATAAKFKGALRRELEWLSRGPQARSTKQKARIQRIEAMREAPTRQAKGQLSLSTASRRIGKRAITAENVSIAVPGGGRSLLREFSYDFSPEDRVGIIGPNGSGKSSLLDLIAGRRQAEGGSLELGSTVQLAYFDQQAEALVAGGGLDRKVIEYVQEAASQIDLGGVQVSASQLLERFLFPPAQQHSPISKLSGGERRRLYLCRLLIQAPNVLLLDEPTNDLDVQTLTVLEDFLEDFRGCVVVVSHDRYFLDRTIDRLFWFEDGLLKRFEGNYSAYLAQAGPATAQATSKPAAASPKAASGAPSKPPGKGTGNSLGAGNGNKAAGAEDERRRSFSENRELSELEGQLPRLEAQRSQLEQQLLAGAERDYGQLDSLTQELSALAERIHRAEERWLELSDLRA
ncbi:ABC-F family ATP-binding cassette domain-containing protein [Synechococcus sp. CS-602]|uniref:ABC-F family ATP-binding cassette domain-containing protein n=1 Tax=Synechococcaceae TaxID=1890426 RepID=UPI0008FF2F96|nr:MULTISPECIES: ABC-F family ATP-binding cassette domain-containing protein [Synechococcaceae]MCT4363928.1 ABC-F family ATP-binding cassette domain-containing protein [Candidatus Regnicoccus frigidus MAG-AL1]APD48449.1 multidrug ABC transporter ATP-binding protein [Synechococcus sp. SynAce01]MCT0201356.1 ABC-F family ATP-binding cassette domain-containing protein [Synechococcus sp. CS-603]MCT0205906.1 ABC-F family ATP-binding cassette domain-containing protein [Synechococcus sp. CS-602]MCT024